jgi:SAM-dependent methyltransferase
VSDAYADSAEFIDLLISPLWEGLGPALADAVKGSDTSAPALDIGAGSGRGTAVLARALPGAEILAIEPSPGLRSALLAWVFADAGLRDRVTVLPESVLDAALPDRIGVAVAMNVIGHLSPEERRVLWGRLAARLVSGGRLVVNLQPPAEPVTVPRVRSGDARVGRRRYEGWASAEPAGETALTWHMTYRVLHEENLVEERHVDYHWHLVSEATLIQEWTHAGLTPHRLEPAGQGLYAATRQAP